MPIYIVIRYYRARFCSLDGLLCNRKSLCPSWASPPPNWTECFLSHSRSRCPYEARLPLIIPRRKNECQPEGSRFLRCSPRTPRAHKVIPYLECQCRCRAYHIKSSIYTRYRKLLFKIPNVPCQKVVMENRESKTHMDWLDIVQKARPYEQDKFKKRSPITMKELLR